MFDGLTCDEIPVGAIAQFHSLQHGFRRGRLPKHDRRFFRSGASFWLQKLVNEVEQLAPGSILTGADARVTRLRLDDAG